MESLVIEVMSIETVRKLRRVNCKDGKKKGVKSVQVFVQTGNMMRIQKEKLKG